MLSSSLLLCATIATADPGFYYGGGLSFSNAESTYGNATDTSHESSVALGLTLGYRFERGTSFFGPEADIDIFAASDFASNGQDCSVYANGPYYCKRDATIRLRGIYGKKLNSGLEVFGTAGLGMMIGEGAVYYSPSDRDRGINIGYTLGAGMQKSITERGMLRGEVIYDRFDKTSTKPTDSFGSAYEPDYQATTFKLSYIMKF